MSLEAINSPEQRRDYKSALDAILDRALNPETIDTYADDALTDLVDLVEDATFDYEGEPTICFETQKDTEAATFRYYKLGEVEQILDHIADTADEIKKLDTVIARIVTKDKVIVPTAEPNRLPISEGDGSFEAKKIIPRLKTTLFVLANDFGVNVYDEDRIPGAKGVIKTNMMRQTSYCMLEVPELKRTIMVCDEEGNVTYVYNSALLEEYGIDAEYLSDLTKPECDDLIHGDSRLGRRVKYGPNFVPYLVDAIEDPAGNAFGKNDMHEMSTYLRPPFPEDHTSIDELAEQLHVSRGTIKRAIVELDEVMGKVTRYRNTGSRGVKVGLSPTQQLTIIERLNEKGTLNNFLPEGDITIDEFVEMYGSTKKVVLKHMRILADSLGDIPKYRIGIGPGRYGLNEVRVNTLREHMAEQGCFVERPPEGVYSLPQAGEMLGVADKTLARGMELLAEQLGEINIYRFNTFSTHGLSDVQIEILRQHFETQGHYSDTVPEGYMSRGDVADKYEVAFSTVEKAIKFLGDKLGEIRTFKNLTHIGEYLSPTQQTLIYEQLVQMGLFRPEAPADYSSRWGMCEEWGVTFSAISRVIKVLGDSLGEVELYKFGIKLTQGFSPTQKEQIKQQLMTRKLYRDRLSQT